ncbi:MAG TPA: hypothetical protein VGK06_08995 [Methanosarcina sp.]
MKKILEAAPECKKVAFLFKTLIVRLVTQLTQLNKMPVSEEEQSNKRGSWKDLRALDCSVGL